MFESETDQGIEGFAQTQGIKSGALDQKSSTLSTKPFSPWLTAYTLTYRSSSFLFHLDVSHSLSLYDNTLMFTGMIFLSNEFWEEFPVCDPRRDDCRREVDEGENSFPDL